MKCPRIDFKVASCNKFLFEVKVDSVLSKIDLYLNFVQKFLSLTRILLFSLR